MDCWDFTSQHSIGFDVTKSGPNVIGTNDMANTANAYVDCGVGYYSRPLDFMCKPCPKGHYCDSTNTAVPTKCAGGTWADMGMDSSSCNACPSDYYSLEGSEYCSPVPPGYKINSGNDGIEICPHTTYSRWGETSCSDCVDGFLCPEGSEIGDDWHNSCPRGSYCVAGVQTKCPAG